MRKEIWFNWGNLIIQDLELNKPAQQDLSEKLNDIIKSQYLKVFLISK